LSPNKGSVEPSFKIWSYASTKKEKRDGLNGSGRKVG